MAGRSNALKASALVQLASHGETFAPDLFVEDAGNGNVRLIFGTSRSGVILEAVSVVMPLPLCPPALADLADPSLANYQPGPPRP